MYFTLRVQKRRLLAQPRCTTLAKVASAVLEIYTAGEKPCEIINKGVNVGICQQGSLNVARRSFNVQNMQKAVFACSRVSFNVFFARVKKAF